MNFDFFNPVRLITGEGCVLENAAVLSELGKSCLIVTSGTAAKKSGALGDVINALDGQGIPYMIFDGVGQNPTMESCMKAGAVARENKLEFIIGIGGGSPLDAAKAAAVYAANDMADGMDIYKMDWPNPALPIALIGTTAGTGSEVTCFSIVTMPNGRKRSFGNVQTYPKVMFGDWRYTATLPLGFTISTALDSIAHALEAYFSLAANGMTDVFAIKATAVLCGQLRLLKSAKDIGDITMEQRERLYFASILAGYALSHCGTLYPHNLSYYLTESHGVPHGFACAATLPDLIGRGVRYAPERAARLFSEAGTDEKELCGLIEELRELPDIKLSKEVIEQIATEGAKSKNFGKTIPSGFSAQEARELLTKLYS